ncbi:ABC transporter permease subunit [Candidatus Symbiopectobacterium sp.]|uniref:ABC transporter permease subunit n=1 Tax=Candidatus Symbiopectobacterium sp. TaxID=2816440 RepID=UPI0025BDE3B0|nr:ABC transporter permease subunit [Candidatus Symbiopectobacterium sp.]
MLPLPSFSSRLAGIALVLPALLVVALCFIAPLGLSVCGAFVSEQGIGGANFVTALALYNPDILFTLLIVGVSTLLIGLFSVLIGGYLTLGENLRWVALLRWVYRWPLFIPFIVTGQILRTFLAKNGWLNGALDMVGIVDIARASNWLDWRGIVFAFVWKQTPFVALLVSGAMASLDRGTMESAHNLGAGRLRILFEIVVPQVWHTLLTGLILSFVTMMSVLSVPLMINAQSPTLLSDNIAFRINAYGDYGVANALGAISLLMTGGICDYLSAYQHEGEIMRLILGWIVPALMLGVMIFLIFGPLANLLMWAMAEKWFYPHLLPTEWGFAFWRRVFSARSVAWEALCNSVLVAICTVLASLALAIPAGYALARLALPARGVILLIFLIPQAFPNLTVYVNIAQSCIQYVDCSVKCPVLDVEYSG